MMTRTSRRHVIGAGLCLALVLMLLQGGPGGAPPRESASHMQILESEAAPASPAARRAAEPLRLSAPRWALEERQAPQVEDDVDPTQHPVARRRILARGRSRRQRARSLPPGDVRQACLDLEPAKQVSIERLAQEEARQLVVVGEGAAQRVFDAGRKNAMIDILHGKSVGTYVGPDAETKIAEDA